MGITGVISQRRSLAVLIVALGCALSFLARAVGQSEPKNSSDDPVVAAAANDRAVYEYVGGKTCRMCHSVQHRAWLHTAKGDSWDALLPSNGTDVKRLAGLDPAKNYTRDARCLRCHATGFGKPGGYAIPTSASGSAARKATVRQGAGCESCHGPGSGFVAIMKTIHRNERTYRRSELLAAGRAVVGAKVCMECHGVSALCVASRYQDVDDSALRRRFEDDIRRRHGIHEKVPLKYRDPEDREDSLSTSEK